MCKFIEVLQVMLCCLSFILEHYKNQGMPEFMQDGDQYILLSIFAYGCRQWEMVIGFLKIYMMTARKLLGCKCNF